MSSRPDGPVVLVVLDGFGLREETEGNAIARAETPVLDGWFREQPWSRLTAAGGAVGLPAGQIGNSEVGHMNLGAGRTVHQPLTRINRAVEDGSFFDNEVLNDVIDGVLERDATLHLVGLVSDGGVHSHLKHLEALLELTDRRGCESTAVHAMLDGRDVPPRSARPYLERLVSTMRRLGTGRVGSVMGRYYGMDRDERWDRTEAAYRTIVEGKAPEEAPTPLEALARAYERGENDEFVTPTVILEDGEPAAPVDPEDGIVFFNFRPDRARQMTAALTQEGFDAFEVPFHVSNFACMARYDEAFDLPVAFPPLDLHNVLGEYLSDRGRRQYHAAETEKYAHVTFFFNGGREEPFPGEERKLIPSPKVSTYDTRPEMSAPGITDALLERLDTDEDDFVVVNFANLDMVGHTGDLEATMRAAEALDECLGRLGEAVRRRDGEMLVTADHGNAEMMVDPETGENHTAHTTNDCPLIYVGPRRVTLRGGGSLKDVAPTVLDLMDMEVPEEMTGTSRLEEVTTAASP